MEDDSPCCEDDTKQNTETVEVCYGEGFTKTIYVHYCTECGSVDEVTQWAT